MAIDVALLLSFVFTLITVLISAVVPWAITSTARKVLAMVFAGGIIASILITLWSLALYPLSNLVVLLVALSGGTLLGRVLSRRVEPILILLLILSVLDIVQVVLTSHPTPPTNPRVLPPSAQLVGNLYLLLPWGHYNIGGGDIAVIAALSEQWRRRGQPIALALVPGAAGTLLAFAFSWLIFKGALPLVPFFTIGWLCSISWAYASSRRSSRLRS